MEASSRAPTQGGPQPPIGLRLGAAPNRSRADRSRPQAIASAPSTDEGEPDGVSLKEFTAFVIKMGHWASGTAVHYKESIVVAAEATINLLAPGLPLGKRFESHQVVLMADARPWHLGDRLESDGKWRIILFAGDVRDLTQRQNWTRSRLTSTPLSPSADRRSDILWPQRARSVPVTISRSFSDDESWFSGHGEFFAGFMMPVVA
ncbi:BQ5605_C024g09938 [Microbotryum silenes-dioicae]|uniref:BQ5605_C024g09938 protein n=1 Tax=Microbotryum silenes-dioicae TaxID=796604 RepID=A0A2X0MLZ7_9BASI|nr:BQ5605_C024g09938 [Microbotryum silenes-dioicae]